VTNKPPKKRSSKAIFLSICTAIAAVAVTADHFSSTLSNLGNLFGPNKQPTVTASASPAQPQRTAPIEKQTPKATSATPAKAAIQVATGDQSPNIRNAQKAVRLEYRGAPAATAASNGNVPIRIPKASSMQVSTGNQSPNIDGTKGDVDIKFIQAASELKNGQGQNAQN
jgi:hypothetical protein